MRTDTGQVFRLEDYRPSDYLIPETHLSFSLAPEATIVVAELTIARQPGAKRAPLVLDGDGLVLKRLLIDGEKADASAYAPPPSGSPSPGHPPGNGSR